MTINEKMKRQRREARIKWIKSRLMSGVNFNRFQSPEMMEPMPDSYWDRFKFNANPQS